MSTRLLLALIAALLIVRLPSLVQPMGPDQGLYAYVGERILHGDLAYRDAWDQKPPGIHYVYAALRAAWPGDASVAAADLAAAAAIAWLLWALGWRLGGPSAALVAPAAFLLLADPAFTRYSGVRVRSQCETFIALAVTAAMLLAVMTPRASRRTLTCVAMGLLIGAAFVLKYNAAVYGLVVLATMAFTRGTTLRDIALVAAGAAILPLVLLGVFASGHAIADL